MSKKVTVLFATLLLIILFLPNVSAGLEKPDLQVGQWWKLSESIYEYLYKVSGEQKIKVNGKEHNVFVIDISRDNNLYTRNYYEKSNYNPIKIEVFDSHGNITSTQVYENIGSGWKYPIEIGDNWIDNAIVHSINSMGETENQIKISNICIGTQDIVVPAGSFDTYVIYSDMDSFKINYYFSSVVGWIPVKSEFITENESILISTQELISYGIEDIPTETTSSFERTLTSSASLQLTDGVTVSASYTINATMRIPNEGGIPGETKKCEIKLDNGQLTLSVNVSKWGISESGTYQQSFPIGSSMDVPIPNTGGLIKAPVSLSATLNNIQGSNILSIDTDSLNFNSEGKKTFNVTISDSAKIGDYFNISAVVNLDLQVGIIVDLIEGSQSLAKETLPMSSMSPTLELTGIVKSQLSGGSEEVIQLDNPYFLIILLILIVIIGVIAIAISKKKSKK